MRYEGQDSTDQSIPISFYFFLKKSTTPSADVSPEMDLSKLISFDTTTGEFINNPTPPASDMPVCLDLDYFWYALNFFGTSNNSVNY